MRQIPLDTNNFGIKEDIVTGTEGGSRKYWKGGNGDRFTTLPMEH